MNTEIQVLLRESVIDVKNFDKNHLTGFCTFNPKISAYALENKDNLAETLVFIIASQQNDWPTLVGSFKHMIFKLQKDGSLYDDIPNKRYSSDTPYFKAIGWLGSKRIEPIDFIWQQREGIFSMVKGILSKFNYHDTSKENEEAVLKLFKYYLTLPQLALAKAGFAVQMTTGRMGCFDSINTQIYPVPVEYINSLWDKNGNSRPIKNLAQASFDRKLQEYIQMLNLLSQSADSPFNKKLWDAWTHVVADRINNIGEPDDTVVKYGKEQQKLHGYPNITNSKYPDITKYISKYKGNITGDEVSRQHQMPVLIHGESVNDRIENRLTEYVDINGVLYESAMLFESELDPHSTERMKQRFEVMTKDDISEEEKQNIFNNLEKVVNTNFGKRYSYAIMLGQFRPRITSKYAMKENGRDYYQIPAPAELRVGEKSSIGNQVWCLIRNNVVSTIFLRKSEQTRDLKMNSQNMVVDFSIKDINNFNNNGNNSR
jgi:hypothetical protein